MMQAPLVFDARQQVLQLRRFRHELALQSCDSQHRRLYDVSGYRVFVADVFEFAGDTGQPVPAREE